MNYETIKSLLASLYKREEADSFPLLKKEGEGGFRNSQYSEFVELLMRFHYDKKKDAFYIRFAENPYAESAEIEEGVIFDYDRKGKLIGIEILDASKRLAPSFRSQLLHHALPLKIVQGMVAK